MKHFLKKNWKPLAFWSGLGGLVFGGALFAYKKGYVGTSNPPLTLPEGEKEIKLRTTPFEIDVEDRSISVWCEYHLLPTRFLFQSVIEGRGREHRIYFVNPLRHLSEPGGGERLIQTESFYAMVGIPRYFKKSDLMDHVRKGSQVIFHLCLVGGGPTGIPSGERVLSTGKLESWEF